MDISGHTGSMERSSHCDVSEPVAVIGLSGFFPGSVTLREFFCNALKKRCFVRQLPDWHWEQDLYFSRDAAEPVKSYSRLGGLLPDLDTDLTRFRIPPTVAAQMSGNQKLALICAEAALADAGCLERDFDRDRFGVILAAAGGDLAEMHAETMLASRIRSQLESLASTAEHRRVLDELWSRYQSDALRLPITEDTLPGQSGHLVAGRIASAFDLHGPNLVIDSACASSLAAITTAVSSLRSGVCDTVMTGGVDTEVGVSSYVLFSKVSALSGEGSFPFDQRGDGFVIGEGCGLLVLKRYHDALRNGDRIYGLIRGCGCSSDGAGKSVTAPNSDGQLSAMQRAFEDAGLSPRDLDFVECHGTGTRVGDATELRSLARLLHDAGLTGGRRSALPIGSVKAMTGHLKLAAGAAGLFRGMIAVNSRVVPPQVHFEKANTGIDWDQSGLRVPQRPERIEKDEVVVGVSGFGFGGTNFHLVLSSTPRNARRPIVQAEDFMLPELPPLKSDIAFLFPGQGSQYVGMLAALRGDPVAEELFSRADAITAEITGRRITEYMYPASSRVVTKEQRAQRERELMATQIAQPAIFAVSAALLDKVRSRGIDCALAIGHSLGEYSALYAAGMIGFEEAIRAVTRRGVLMSELTRQVPGKMAFVRSNPSVVQPLLDEVDGYVICANLNSYDQVVIAGETDAVAAAVDLATARGLNAQTLPVDRAFHSRLMSPCVPPLQDDLNKLGFLNATLPVPANISRQVYPFVTDVADVGQPMSEKDRRRAADLLCRQVDSPVDFVAQVELAFESGIRRFVEVGPKSVLTRLVDGMLQGKMFQAISLDEPGIDIRKGLDCLQAELAAPLAFRRRPLPTRPRRSQVVSLPCDADEPQSAADKVRHIVSRVSGYDASIIGDESEFERDLGIDTLKIFEIIASLRGSLLPQEFANYREATSVRKILEYAEAHAAHQEGVREPVAVPAGSGGVRCHRYETVNGQLARNPLTTAGDRCYRISFAPELRSLPADLTGFERLSDPGSRDTLIVLPLPTSGRQLCEQTVPRLLREVIELADRSRHRPAGTGRQSRQPDTSCQSVAVGELYPENKPSRAEETQVHLITLSTPAGFHSASYRALCGFTKAVQKDLRELSFSYSHLDTLDADEDFLRRVLAEPVLGRRVHADAGYEQGRLLPDSPTGGSIDELAEQLDSDDVILVTGGARGIAASIVQRLLPVVTARFVLIGRRPRVEDWIARQGRGRVEYLAADLCDAKATAALRLSDRRITLVIHAAGIGAARPIRDIDPAEMASILGVKVLGLENVLCGLDRSQLRGIVNFSSINAVFGGDGHPDYSAGNAYLDGFECAPVPVLSIGWTAWDEVGMAVGASTRHFLDMAGIEMLPVAEGVQTFAELLADFLKTKRRGTQSVVVCKGMGESCFLKRDPLGAAMVSKSPTKTEQLRSAIDSVGSVTSWNPPPLPSAAILAPPQFQLADARVILLDLEAAADHAERHWMPTLTASEREEIRSVATPKRRREKLAGKVAVKQLAHAISQEWLGTDCNPAGIEVLSPHAPVQVNVPGDPLVDAMFNKLYFSISHSEGLVCVSAARRHVGIDVEKVRLLSAETIRDIGLPDQRMFVHPAGESTDAPLSATGADPSALPIVLFTQKEAVLKANGIGLARGVAGVEIIEAATDRPVEARYDGIKYHVCSTLHEGYVISVALAADDAGSSGQQNPPARRVTTPSFGQEGIWFLEQSADVGATHCVAWTQRLTGRLDVPALQKSLQHLVNRHDSLRSVFREADGTCQCEIQSTVTIHLPLVDLRRHVSSTSLERELQRRCDTEARRPFDLSRGPLLRAIVYRLRDDEHVVLFVLHHIIIDSTSALTFRCELAYCYGEFSAGRTPQMLPLPLQYSDYARHQRERLQGPRLERMIDYWRNKLDGSPSLLELPTDRPRPARQRYEAGSVAFTVPADLVHAVKELSRSRGVTLFVTCLAAFQTLLMRLTGQDDVVVGAPFGGRTDKATYPLVGYFVNILPLRARLAGNPRFADLLSQVRETVVDALAHQELPFQKLVEAVVPRRDSSFAPLFQAAIRLLHENEQGVGLAGTKQTFQEVPANGTAYDLSLILGIGDNESHGRLEYNRGIFEASSIEMMAGRFLSILQAVAADPQTRVGDLPIMDADEQHQILAAWNATARAFPDDRCVHELFEDQAERTPNSMAVEFGERRLTYRELNGRANRIARHLRQRGIGPDDTVAVYAEPSPEFVAAVLGTLKAGGAYLPLDPNDPAERVRQVLGDARPRSLLAQSHFCARLGRDLPGWSPDCIEDVWSGSEGPLYENLPTVTSADHLAYIMYTSGSTGRPKGVCVPHQAVNRLVVNCDYVQLGPDDVMAQISKCNFDAATFEIWGALLNGARLTGIDRDCALTPRRLAAAISQRGITTLFVTTALFNELADEMPTVFQGVRQVLFGGEECDRRAVRKIVESGGPPERLLHVYGPTETTTFATWYCVPRQDDGGDEKVPIGRPVGNTQVYVLDRYQKPVPVGVAGEIHIAGPGLARGYWSRADLTEQRFVANPFEPGTRLYRTGDLARWRADGNLEFLGRRDRQVKLRGFRIELEEIESVLREHPAVRDAVVVAQATHRGDKQLVAYVVPRHDSPLCRSELSGYLKHRLPAYMVPADWVTLERLPMTAAGKIDYGALPSAPAARRDRSPISCGPSSPVEEMLVKIWAKVLGVSRVGIDDNFFELGGHSLLAVKLCARMEKAFGVKLPLTVFFEAATIRHMAAIVQGRRGVDTWSSLVPIRASGSRPPFYCIHGGDGQILKFHLLAEHLGPEQPVFVLQSRAVEGREAPLSTVEEIAAAYLKEIRAFQPDGPYLLGGYSFGGLVAFEMARRLRLQDQAVPLLALFDTLYPESETDAATVLGHTWQRYSRAIRRAVAHRIYSICQRLGRPVPGFVRNFLIRDTHRRAAVEFKLQTYPGRITYFAAEDDNAIARIQQWRQHATNGVEIRRVQGLHSDLFKSDSTGSLMKELRDCLNHATETEARAHTDPSLPAPRDTLGADMPIATPTDQSLHRRAA